MVNIILNLYFNKGYGIEILIDTGELKNAGFETINDGIREMWKPDDDAIVRCKNFCESIGAIIGETI
ncbi:hypothetical protein KPL37_15745 [Clostridium frigoris]|uniref:Uncharacterized protein n=1 Tax=Clostridium frigoris TaxID=205327 RepID=A0ABS6BX46_9CLOT|nr:hypothetical protein [Clostridium frigoris]MBU3161172.1 hypothetical protein [Clostridium frigoris]